MPRVTIVLDDKNDKLLRMLQAKQIKETQTSVSFSRVINNVVSKALKA